MSKKKSKNATPKRTSQFRYHKVSVIKNGKEKEIWHPTYIFMIIGNVFRYITITHSKSVDGEEVVLLEQSPNKKDNRPAYRVVGYKEDTKDRFGKKHKWRISKKDEEEIRKSNKKR